MEIFNNAWVVGIGGGILSGLIVTLITRYIFSKKDNREYAQKISTVNREVIYALRPGISEGHIPDNEVLSSLINATARKYKVERSDAYQAKQIAEELIKEIMDSSFISSETKKNYCETLAHLVSTERAEAIPSESRIERISIESEFRKTQNERMSAVLGMTAAIGTMLAATTTTIMNKEIFSSPIKSAIGIALPTVTVLVAVVIGTSAMLLSVKLKNAQKNKKNG